MVKGRCLCGKIAFEFNSSDTKTVLCHCLNCKKITGSAYSTNVTVPSSAVTLQTGKPKEFSFDSGQGPVFKISFCADCSSTLWKESDAPGFKGYHIIQSGALGEGCDDYRPQGEIFTPYRSKWLEPMEDVKQFEGTDTGL
ncbi:Mss4-like protein [Clohesyomyces aquaticus]|uniref:Mss4-like protein n=1 Tax=Clohesyomyces aquaticus TaxID=1231657 RepID=A0A1Y1Z4G9_9PLEO|nr:Mss4-like protein [Clohesyomyces aquaticus]